MLSGHKTVKQGQHIPFLSEPTCIPELDNWIATYIQQRKRFTFREEDVLADIWQQGEDLRLREDERFRIVPFAVQTHKQWYLAAHTLANEYLYELLLDDAWDGCDLFKQLERHDKREAQSYYVFCPQDIRFQLAQEESGIYNLTLREIAPAIILTSEQKEIVDKLAAQLLEQAMLTVRPYTTTTLIEMLQHLAPDEISLRSILPQALAHWLLYQKEWVRVGIDTWIPTKQMPILPVRHRYAVPPPSFSSIDERDTLPQPVPDQIIARDIPAEDKQGTIEEIDQEGQRQIRWHILLKTAHINEGILPVPPQARSLYPHVPKLANVVALSGLWFDDGNKMALWLDREQNRLFGPDLEEQFTFIEAGTRLDIHWNSSGLIFYISGVDTQVAEEETRLIDLTSLAQLRNQTLESYRASLRLILETSTHPLSFRDLYTQLCERQHHTVNSATIRAVLSSSPEFAYDSLSKQWALHPSEDKEVGAKRLRHVTTIAKHLKESPIDSEQSQVNQQDRQETPSLSQMVAGSRQRLTLLRSRYLSTG